MLQQLSAGGATVVASSSIMACGLACFCSHYKTHYSARSNRGKFSTGAFGDSTSRRESQLITVDQLAARIESRTNPPVIIDLASPEETDQRSIPGSHRLWRPDYQHPTGLDGMVPTPAAFTALARRLGIHPSTEVIIVDRKFDGTRLWWLFQVFGKASGTVKLLDGGWDAWRAAQPMTQEASPPPKEPGTWTATDADMRLVATREDVLALRSAPLPRLWDVRTVAEYSGTTTLRNAAKPGRIPWNSGRVEWDLFRRPDGGWRSSDEICALAKSNFGMDGVRRGEEEDAGHPEGDTDARRCSGPPQTFYCQSGVRTTQLIFGLALAGWPLEELRNYDGSWVEWSHLAEDRDVLVEVTPKE